MRQRHLRYPTTGFSVSPDPTASRVNEGLSGVARSRDYAAFGVGAGIRLKPPENEGVRRNHGGAEIECGGGGAGPFGAGGADKKRDSILIGVARPAIGILARFT